MFCQRCERKALLEVRSHHFAQPHAVNRERKENKDDMIIQLALEHADTNQRFLYFLATATTNTHPK